MMNAVNEQQQYKPRLFEAFNSRSGFIGDFTAVENSIFAQHCDCLVIPQEAFISSKLDSRMFSVKFKRGVPDQRKFEIGKQLQLPQYGAFTTLYVMGSYAVFFHNNQRISNSEKFL
jgi:hypothetical protein